LSVASITEISAESPDGFDAAIREGIERANKTLRGVMHAWVGDQEVVLDNGQVTAYRVRLKITFMLEDPS